MFHSLIKNFITTHMSGFIFLPSVVAGITKYKVNCIAQFHELIFCGCGDNGLRVYQPQTSHKDSSSHAYNCIFEDSKFGKNITQLEIVPYYNLLIAIINETVHFYKIISNYDRYTKRVNESKIENTTTLNSKIIIGKLLVSVEHLFSVTFPQNKSKRHVQASSVACSKAWCKGEEKTLLIGIGYQRSLRLLQWIHKDKKANDFDSASGQLRMSDVVRTIKYYQLPDRPRCIIFAANYVFLVLRNFNRYDLLKLQDGSRKTLFQGGNSKRCVGIRTNTKEVLLVVDKYGFFMNYDGTPSRKECIEWGNVPNKLLYAYPYIVALLDKSMQVHHVDTLVCVARYRYDCWINKENMSNHSYNYESGCFSSYKGNDDIWRSYVTVNTSAGIIAFKMGGLTEQLQNLVNNKHWHEAMYMCKKIVQKEFNIEEYNEATLQYIDEVNTYCSLQVLVNNTKFDERKKYFEIGMKMIELSLSNCKEENVNMTSYNSKVLESIIKISKTLNMNTVLALYLDHGVNDNSNINGNLKIEQKSNVEVDNDSKHHDEDEYHDWKGVAVSSEIDEWMADINEMQNITFITQNELSENYAKSVEIEDKQKNELEMTTKSVLQTFEQKCALEKQVAKLQLESQQERLKTKEKSKNLQENEATIEELLVMIESKAKQHVDIANGYDESLRRSKDFEQELQSKQATVNEYDVLLEKYKQFSQKSWQYLQSMESQRNQALNKFESNWMDWDYKDVVFWFKIILGYFECALKYKNISINSGINGADNNSNLYNDNDNKVNVNFDATVNAKDKEDSKEQEKEINILKIDFENKIHSNLESQRIRGKFLSLINKNDLKNLGFEIFEHQCILHKSIEKLVEKYPISKENDSKSVTNKNDNYNYNYRYNDQIEGLNVQPTGRIEKKLDVGDVDKKYICPITQDLMKSPVIAYDGCVYEKDAIINYLRQHHTTPKQKDKKLENKEKVEQMIQMLFPHFQLQKEIQMIKLHD